MQVSHIKRRRERETNREEEEGNLPKIFVTVSARHIEITYIH
jgi:hypothetical protein